MVLAGDGDGSGYGDGEGAALADGVVEDGVDAAEEGAAEGGEAVGDEVAEGIALVDAFYFNWVGDALNSILLELAAEAF